MSGRPWIDFEWLTQLLYHALHALAGCAGLIATRAVPLTLALGLTLRLLRRGGTSEGARGLAALWLGSALLAFTDVRPDNASLFFFALTLYGLEELRLGRRSVGAGWTLPVALLYGLWANMHLGVLYGLLLIALYAAGALIEGARGAGVRRWDGFKGLSGLFAVAALATLANPFGWRLFTVAVEHLRDSAAISSLLVEWRPPNAGNAWMWSYWPLLVACPAALLLAAAKKKTVSPAVALSVSYFAYASATHQRHIPYFALVAIPALFGEREAIRPGRVGRAAGAVLFVLLCGHWAVTVLPTFPVVTGSRWCSVLGRHVAGFLEREEPTLGGKTLFNSWGQGGYLGYRLPPAYRVFYDGRYLFHDLLAESTAALADPRSWQAFLDRHDIEVAWLDRGSPGKKLGAQPYYDRFMPAKDWALVFWNDHDLLFVRRRAMPRAWLSSREYRILRPDDFPRLATAAAGGTLDLRELEREARLHRETTTGSSEDAAIEAWRTGLQPVRQ